MAHRVTIQDLARQAGVSLSTIDRIMKGRNKVCSGTVARVFAHLISRLANASVAHVPRDLQAGNRVSKRITCFDIFTPGNI
jgi:transcriptional regulator with XRE-family HTH domain